MQFITYDFEIFKHDWLVVFKKGEDFTVIHNSSELLQEYYNSNKNNVFVGFNNKHFDDYIFKGILSGLLPKRISDFIIAQGKFGWEYPGMKYMSLITLDVKQDLSDNRFLSLKEAEGNMGMSIEESDVPFDIERPLTAEELESVIGYCKHDVLATEQILIRRMGDVKVRLELLQMFNLPLSNIGKTNAKLTATILGARQRPHHDEFEYDFPDNLVLENKELKDFFSHTLNYDEKVNVTVDGVEHIVAFGGLHGAKNGIFEGNLWYADVGSYYPTLMIQYNYNSRNLNDVGKYAEIYTLRMQYKSLKDPREVGLKLLLNTTYGTLKDKYNAMYDPKQANQVCITGQLFLIDLLEKLTPYMELIQSNTDGIIFKSHNDARCQEILDEWQLRTKMSLKIVKVNKIWQKDVNNYILQNGNKLEVKGAYVKYYDGGSFSNNSTVVLHRAIVNHFVYGISPEETINGSTNLMDFQYIRKKGPTYKHVEHDGKILNNCNRIFASNDTRLGKVYKVREDGHKEKMASLPENCIVINEDLSTTKFTINNIDKTWYIKEAYRKIQGFFTDEIEEE